LEKNIANFAKKKGGKSLTRNKETKMSIEQFCQCNIQQYTVKMNTLYLINKIVETDYKQYY